MPDLLGHLVDRRDCRSGPAMTGESGPAMTGRDARTVMPDVLGHPL